MLTFTVHKSYCWTITGFEILLHYLQGVSDCLCCHMYCLCGNRITIFQTQTPQLFLSVALKFSYFSPQNPLEVEFAYFNNSPFCFVQHVTICSADRITMPLCSCWFLLHIYRIYANLVCTLFEVFLGPKNRVRIKIDGALDAHTKSETMISLSVGLL